MSRSSRRTASSHVAALCLVLVASDGGAAAQQLRIDPRLVAQAAEVWEVIASEDNPIWPGWNAVDTPLLFYLPGEQEVLINHPRPPAGFVPYSGPIGFPGGRIALRDGPGFIEWDGQNTSREIEGSVTLVVADSLSNLRQRIQGILADPRPVEEKSAGLGFGELSTDPYDQLALITHEAFHVFQQRSAPDKQVDEMLLLHYPTLSAENNAGLALEGAALAAALRAGTAEDSRSAAVAWLAARSERRASLPRQAVDYEDGVEFVEGLAKYAEYRLYGVLVHRQPRSEMWWSQGFRGYSDLGRRAADLIGEMQAHLSGDVLVNGDAYGAAPLRMRLYYSGMAIAALLDRLQPAWKADALEPGVSLTDLASAALAASPESRRVALADLRRANGYEQILAAKRSLEAQGQARIVALLAQIERGPGTGVVLDYANLQPPKVGLAFTPFGVAAVDEDRTIYTQVPIQASFADGSELNQTSPFPLLHDRRLKRIGFRLSRQLTESEMATMAAGEAANLGVPEFVLVSKTAKIERRGRDLWITLGSRR